MKRIMALVLVVMVGFGGLAGAAEYSGLSVDRVAIAMMISGGNIVVVEDGKSGYELVVVSDFEAKKTTLYYILYEPCYGVDSITCRIAVQTFKSENFGESWTRHLEAQGVN